MLLRLITGFIFAYSLYKILALDAYYTIGYEHSNESIRSRETECEDSMPFSGFIFVYSFDILRSIFIGWKKA